MDRKFMMTALGYAIVGMLLGIHMAATHNHIQHVTHAHIMLIGFVISMAYALCHKLWLGNLTSGLAKAQYYLHQVGTIVILISLFLMYGNFASVQTMEPFLAISSIVVLLGMILMKVLFIKHSKSA
ncbi:TonB-dependent receptor [Alcanivorax sp. S6407]|uniref:TonB-dependent receptor n=1 Tax=Alcanivorax sp. S6407 TaxID=2926424 RepID=UPI001FF20926|nr:TonB-dependent receptor [Alcanivorax sp. S6407]MCK0154510.1 TonB-dependent receptor [Alcanivorax sp. S6407]